MLYATVLYELSQVRQSKHFLQPQWQVEIKLNADRELRYLLVMTTPQDSPCILQRFNVRRIRISLHRLQESPRHGATVLTCDVSILSVTLVTHVLHADK